MENDCTGGALRVGVLIIAAEIALCAFGWLVWVAVERIGG